MNKQEKATFWANPVVQSISASVLCIVLGLLIGFVVLSLINANGAGEAIVTLLKNFLTYSAPAAQKKYLGNTLVKTAPLLMCALSIQFCYKVGLFNIGCAGQYVMGSGLALYAALTLKLPWIVCVLFAICARGLGPHRGCLKGIPQRQRGHLRHHAQLDRPVPSQHALNAGQGTGLPLHGAGL